LGTVYGAVPAVSSATVAEPTDGGIQVTAAEDYQYVIDEIDREQLGLEAQLPSALTPIIWQ